MAGDSPETDLSADAMGVGSTTQRDRDRMRLAILLLMAGGAAYLILRLLAPFTLAIVTSGVVAVMAHPVYERTRRALGNESAAAAVVSAAAFLLLLVPLVGLVILLVEGVQSGVSVVIDRLRNFADRQGEAWELLRSLGAALGIQEQDLADTVESQLSGLGNVLAGGTFGVLSGLGQWLAQAGIGLFTLFYLLRDGDEFLAVARWLIPLDEDVTDALFAKTVEVITATVLGTLLVAAAQGFAGGLLFWALDLPAPVLWGTVMAVLGLLPIVGPPVVWIPAAVLLLTSGHIAKALILTAAGALIVGTIDNVLRAVLVGGRAQLHSLVVFFSVLGGVLVFGASGFLFGPVLVVVAFSVLEVARVALEGSEASRRFSKRETILSRAPPS